MKVKKNLMNRDPDAGPGDVDPNTIQVDGDPSAQESLSVTAKAEILGGSKYRRVKCFNKAKGTFVGYLSSRDSQSTALGIGKDYPRRSATGWRRADGSTSHERPNRTTAAWE
jgi:hypothetical protein